VDDASVIAVSRFGLLSLPKIRGDNAMRKRKLGRVAPVMFGGNVFDWTADEATSFRLLDTFTDAGFNAVDTADAYSAWVPGHKGGESEIVLGAWLKKSGKRSNVVVATKLGMLPPNNGLRKTQIETAVEASLKRLQTDYIDLYQAHKDDAGTPLDETLEAFETLKSAGKVRAVGASNYEAPRLKAALRDGAKPGHARYDTLQPLYNLMERGFETELQPLCAEYDMGVIPYFSLAAGFLSGKYRSEADLGKSPRGGGIKKYLNDKGFKVLKALDEVAEAHSATPAEIAIAWVIAQPSISAAIASATEPEQLDALIKAAGLTLTAEDLTALDKASS
jgi:aryl-alcohol dehydrogenase-like predicted oxidoreductase